MVDATFEKVTTSDKPLYGSRKLLLCGFPSAAQPKFETVLGMAALQKIKKIWVTDDQDHMVLSTLLQLPDNSGASVSSNLPRAIIVSGISQNELINLMSVCKKVGMMNALWATLTPVSENWTIQKLLAELAAERKAMTRNS
ncbi:MAG: DUF3783 domain-containing protein [Deltaproteobacteria bacterium]|jgi:hypothetical protein|nr:DUF3783 domain-containing protein [Deltaproteobacteria bacterium]